MRCLYPWTQLYVEATGVVRPCCSLIELGHLRQAAVADVLTADRAASLRDAMARGATAELPPDCPGCYALARQGDLHTFNGMYDIGDDPEAGLRELEALGHTAFVANYRVVQDCYLSGAPLPAEARPLGVWCQLGEHCNIRCVMCWQDHDNPVRLTPAQIEQIRDLIPTLHTLQFTGGEPTVYKAFWNLLGHFRTHATPRSKVVVLTNGLLLKDRLDRFDGIGRVGLAVNVDGPTRDSYEKIRRGGKWDVLRANLDAVREYRDRPGNLGRVSLTLAFTLMRSNLDLIPEGIALADEYGAAWTCGIITGEYAPVAQCRTYFAENVFRFSHLGYSKEAILARLRDGLDAARASRHSAALGVSCLEATLALVRQTEQVHIPPETAARLRAIQDDHALSRAILACLQGGVSPVGESPALLQLGGIPAASGPTAVPQPA